MGYETRYNLELSDNSLKDEVVDALRELEVINYALDSNLELYDSVKWYRHKEDMKKISIQFPDVLFTLTGQGEEGEDIWVMYFKGGKGQREKAIITLPEFDESKLK